MFDTPGLELSSFDHLVSPEDSGASEDLVCRFTREAPYDSNVFRMKAGLERVMARPSYDEVWKRMNGSAEAGPPGPASALFRVEGV